MNVAFRLDLPGDPSGQISLPRLIDFAQRFRSAVLKSAQAELSVPSYRKSIAPEAKPEFRLAALGAGSTTLTLESIEDRPLDKTVVVRHLDALTTFRETRAWPKGMYAGELHAWGAVYQALIRHERDRSVEVMLNGQSEAVDSSVITELLNAQMAPEYDNITCVGDLHLIEMSPRRNPRFRIDAEEVDLTFELTPDLMGVVDPLRWHRVRAEALWEIGTNRAQLTGAITATTAEPGVVYRNPSQATAGWVSEQVDRLESFRDIAEGWDGPASKKIPGPMIESAKELSRRLAAQFAAEASNLPSPYFFPSRTGTVEFEWQVQDRFIVCELVTGGYDILVTMSDRVEFEGFVGQRELYAWVTWLLMGTRKP